VRNPFGALFSSDLSVATATSLKVLEILHSLISGLIDGPTQLWNWLFVTAGLAAVLYLVVRCRLVGFTISDKDMKAAGLNRRQRRRLKAKFRRKRARRRIRN